MNRSLWFVGVVALSLPSFPAQAQNDGKTKQPLVIANDEYVVPSIPLDPIPRKKPKKPFPGSAFARVGFQFGTTRTRGDAHTDPLANQGNSFVLDTTSLFYISESDFTFRQGHGFRIGGGSAGFDGSLSLDTAGGMRMRIGPNHGPFMRIGARGQLSGNRALYTSYLEIPQLQLGYQNMNPKVHAEFALRTGVVLAGRYKIGNMGRRRIGTSLELGAYAAFNLEHIKLEASLTRFDVGQNDGQKPVDELALALCGVAKKLAICTDLRLYQGELEIPHTAGDSSFARASYAGLFVGGGYGN